MSCHFQDAFARLLTSDKNGSQSCTYLQTVANMKDIDSWDAGDDSWNKEWSDSSESSCCASDSDDEPASEWCGNRRMNMPASKLHGPTEPGSAHECTSAPAPASTPAPITNDKFCWITGQYLASTPAPVSTPALPICRWAVSPKRPAFCRIPSCHRRCGLMIRKLCFG